MGLGVGGNILKPKLDLAFIELEAPSRIDVDLPLMFGFSGDVGHFWFGPHLVYSHYSMDYKININDGGGGFQRAATVTGNALYTGFTLGGAIGYKYIWLMLELTVAYNVGSADFEIEGLTTIDALATNSLMVAPAVGLLVQF